MTDRFEIQQMNHGQSASPVVQTRPYHVASCSGGKDSVATILLAVQHSEPLDEIIYNEIMFDKSTSGEVPEHRCFIYEQLKPFCEEKLGIRFTVLHAAKTYQDVFYHVVTRGPSTGMFSGFAWAGKCAVNRDCKLPPIKQYLASLPYAAIVDYIGIAADEPRRLERLDGVKQVSLLAKYGISENTAREICEKYDLLSPVYEHSKRNGCWFCPNASDSEFRHIIEHHPDMFDRLIQWEKEENIVHRRLTRTQTPSEVKFRLSAKG